MNKKIFLSSNIPISLPEKLSDNKFNVGFLYDCNGSLELKTENTWIEKLCVSLNKINSVVGFQTSNLKIPEYIAGSLELLTEQLGKTELTVRYNAETKINDLISKISSKNTENSFNDTLAKSITKGNQIILLGEKTLKSIFPKFEEIFGLENKVKFIVNHEFAHNLDSIRGYNRSDVSIKNYLGKHLGAHINNSVKSPFKSNTEFSQAKDLSKQIWTISLEQYADVNGFLNMRNELLENGKSNKEIIKMLDVLIDERKTHFEDNVNKYFEKLNSPLGLCISFKERFDSLKHLTNLALNDLKEKLLKMDDTKISKEEMEKITISIVTKADFKSLYAVYLLEDNSKTLLDKLFESEKNSENEITYCESKKQQFEKQLVEVVGEDWVNTVNRFSNNNKEKNGFYRNIRDVFSLSLDDLKVRNSKDLNERIQSIRKDSLVINTSVNHKPT